MYRLIIVDDEETICEGLCKIVNWKSFGYEVVQVFNDGKSALEYIKRVPVDVILTDIKMTFVSGLELAKYINSNKLDIKVVIMSGYREFELAREALIYNVKYYLLKPTNLEEIRDVFLKLKTELDDEGQRRQMLKSNQEEYRELLKLYREQFFTDLIMGGIRTKEAVDERIKAIKLNISPQTTKICLLNLYFEHKKLHKDNYDKYAFDATLDNYINSKSENIKYFTLLNTDGNTQVLAVSLTDVEICKLEEKSLAYMHILADKIKSIFGITMKITLENTFPNLYEAAAYYKPLVSSADKVNSKIEDMISRDDLLYLTKQKRLFLTYVNSNDSEMSRNLFDNIIDEIKYADINAVHNFIVDLFAGLKSRLGMLGMVLNTSLFRYEEIINANNINKIRRLGHSMLDDILKEVVKYKNAMDNSVIQKAKEYINCNYDKNISLGEVAKYVFLSPIYFSHLFKQKSGETFIDYLTKIRIKKAMELLHNPELKIYEISEKAGYKNTKYFYRLFKEYTGLTPVEYRESITEGRLKNWEEEI
ncbi:MAG: response regulator [Clostridiales bacterium]|nr:response regulator [Clostridiales bacterium]HBM81667.1 hypothetical protein [Clostridiaceae bacterium]